MDRTAKLLSDASAAKQKVFSSMVGMTFALDRYVHGYTLVIIDSVEPDGKIVWVKTLPHEKPFAALRTQLKKPVTLTNKQKAYLGIGAASKIGSDGN